MALNATDTSPLVNRIDNALELSKQTTSPARTVAALNAAGIDNLMRGKTDEALDCFVQALERSGTNDLRAQSLANIGDYVRRIVGDKLFACQIFERAEELDEITLVTQSRIRSMYAMAYMLETEQGSIPKSGDIDQAISLLEDAVGLAQLAQMQKQEEGLKAESFATHRLAGIICQYGSMRAKNELAFRTIPDFTVRLDAEKDYTEIARLNYSKALCMADIDQASRARATEIMLTSARAIESSSPIDACYYFAKAGEWLYAEGNISRARYCLGCAQKKFGVAQTHANARRVIEQVEKLAMLLSES